MRDRRDKLRRFSLGLCKEAQPRCVVDSQGMRAVELDLLGGSWKELNSSRMDKGRSKYQQDLTEGMGQWASGLTFKE